MLLSSFEVSSPLTSAPLLNTQREKYLRPWFQSQSLATYRIMYNYIPLSISENAQSFLNASLEKAGQGGM